MSRPYRSARQKELSAVARETKAALPGILQQLPHLDATESTLHKLDQLPQLRPGDSPRFTVTIGEDSRTTPGTITRVVNDDTLDTAIRLSGEPSSSAASSPTPSTASRVCILNLASDVHPGGGWLSGALAQEESICYRSSLALSLHKTYYPLGPTSSIYTPSVVLIRDPYGAGHKLITGRQPSELDVVSVVSVAAIRRPATTRARTITTNDDGTTSVETAEYETFAKQEDRTLTKDKMRLTLRVAASHGHSRLVLGALGCGAFKNPTEDVAMCWREVLSEPEFAATGWFEHVIFAVLDKGSDGKNAGRDRLGNFEPFAKLLGCVLFADGTDVAKV